MIIRTNLYWEFAEKPPVNPWKARAIFGATLILLMAVGYWYFLRLELQTSRQAALAAEVRHAELRTQREAFQARVEELRMKAEARKPILEYAAGRINFAPLLERVLASAPANVEFTRLQLRTDGQGGFRLLLSGSGAGAQPRLVCDKLRIQLVDALADDYPAALVNFDSLEDAARTIQIEGEKRAVADFTISATWRNAAHGN
jgi:hypothetical protein